MAETTERSRGSSVRAARLDDAPALARIYNTAIGERIATFETRPRTPAEMRELLHAAQQLTLVVERDGEVAGFARASAYSSRECYAGIAEASVYVAREARGGGVGGLALEALADACAERGRWKLVALIFADNDASRRLCARHGFREVGLHRRHGRLDGRWRDCVVVERLLGAAADREFSRIDGIRE